jgi:hypothetical protein
MAGGPHAAIMGCLHCFGPADRIQEGIESDLYQCRDCGKQFGIDWRRGPADRPCWPPTPEEQALIDHLRAQRRAAGPKRPRGDATPGG